MLWATDNQIDLDRFSFEEFVQFVFDHPATEIPEEDELSEDELLEGEAQKDKSWYFTDEWRHGGTPEKVLPLVTRLFRDPEWLREEYSAAQLDQGFWYLGGALWEWLWDEEVPVELRREFVESMVPLEEKLFAKGSLESACFMWWDFFRPFGDEPNKDSLDFVLDALAEVLQIPSEACIYSAVHGLGHVKHPKKRLVLEQYIESHPAIDDNLRNYIHAAMIGKIL